MSDPTPAEKQYYYAGTDAQPVGPQTTEKLRDLRHRGVLTDETLVIEVAGTEWVPYRTLGTGVTLPPVPVPAKGSFLFLIRLATAFVLFVVFAVAIYFGTTYGIAVVEGVTLLVRQNDFSGGYNAGLVQANLQTGLILLVSVGVGALAALGLSFSAALPWCRRRHAHRLAKR
jgi:hypothetical protein